MLACFDRPGTSNGPTEAINGRPGHLRGSALRFRNPHQLHRQEPARDRRVQAATTPCPRVCPEGGNARDQLRASDPAAVDVGETRQLTLNLNPGDNRFVVCGGAPCPAIVQAEFVQERCRSARPEEVSPIFVHSRVLAPSRWSL